MQQQLCVCKGQKTFMSSEILFNCLDAFQKLVRFFGHIARETHL